MFLFIKHQKYKMINDNEMLFIIFIVKAFEFLFNQSRSAGVFIVSSYNYLIL